MYGIRVYWKRKANTEWFATEEEAKSEGMRKDGNIYLLKGNDDGNFNVIGLLKKEYFKEGMTYSFFQWGLEDGYGIARVVSLEGRKAIVDILEASDRKMIGRKEGRYATNIITVKGGIEISPTNPIDWI